METKSNGDKNRIKSLHDLLDWLRSSSKSEREKGTYFEELVVAYLRNEPAYKDRYSDVWTWKEWAPLHGFSAKDDGIDLVAQEAGTGGFCAIQCKFYAPDYRLKKTEIDSFFTASGRKPFTQRLIVSTTLHWSEHADSALNDQQPPVTKIDLHDLESSLIDWSQFRVDEPPALKPKKLLRDHQRQALNAVTAGFATAERGKLIMACGTGKTFTSLKIVEAMAGRGKTVLFLVPSLSLLSQTLTEWTQESEVPLHSFAVCSDHDVGKKRKRREDDAVQTFVHELRYPATTAADKLAHEVSQRADADHMTVVFGTYHSIEVISQAQHQYGLGEFDLVVCDEAHRTTGATYDGEDDSAFVRVHDNDYLHGRKRLYMTATPRIYGDDSKTTAERNSVTLYSMDNEAWFGKELFVINFSTAVQKGLLVDYKVIVLAVEESHINRRLQDLLRDDENQLRVDDAAKIVGCWKALSKIGLVGEEGGHSEHMKRAVAFCQVIEAQYAGSAHKVSSKHIAEMFKAVVEAYQEAEEIDAADRITCEAEHVDGSMNASEKEAKLDWLKAEPAKNTCRILSNVRCLSEGVDVPALDAVLFLTPRNSQVDVVQSVGRVMRNAPGKKRGYVVLPVVIPAGVEPNAALDDNKTYKVVWEVLQALRSHDDRFDAAINRLELEGPDRNKMEVVAITEKISAEGRSKTSRNNSADGATARYDIGRAAPLPSQVSQMSIEFEVGEIERALYAKIVQKCGNRHHWEEWANDIAEIANTHIDRISTAISSPSDSRARIAFDNFAKEIRDDINNDVTDDEIIEMLAQHLITRPVFDALFSDYAFAAYNPMSQVLQRVLEVLDEEHLEKEAQTLQNFYYSVKMRAEGITSATGRQRIIVELYDKFFRNAFTRLTERLGIVYTPVEVVDFIIHSVNDVLKQEFGQTLGSKGVHIIDPFTGTGTFITRLLQSGLITPEQMPYKYKNEIHANELVLLAYYIAAINIEATYHDLSGGNYVPFEGICLTDTFQMYEKQDMVDRAQDNNSRRRKRQKALDIRVIMSNPPYSIGQRSENDNNHNIGYPYLDSRIRETYAARSNAKLAKGLYDSYIRAIRWASDRIGDCGVIGYVTNAGYLDSNSADGLRRCLVDEFSCLYIFNLRGNQRTSGELSRKEGGKIFGSGSRAPIAISILVKNPDSKLHGKIYYHDIGDYLSREEKLEKLDDFHGISGVDKWLGIVPDSYGDWLRQRDDRFGSFMPLGDKKGGQWKLFDNFSQGVSTSRVSWVYNSSSIKLSQNVQGMIEFYNGQLFYIKKHFVCEDKKQKKIVSEKHISYDAKKISWSVNIKKSLVLGKKYNFSHSAIIDSMYRPFFKQWLYYDRDWNERVLQMPYIFNSHSGKNVVIQVNMRFNGMGSIAFISDKLPDLHINGDTQCFPLYLYSHRDPVKNHDLFGSDNILINTRRDAITDEGLDHFLSAYPGESFNKEDLFYYIYGLLHSPDYLERYADNLSKELPRIPRVKSAQDFWAFSRAGRALAKLHIGYEGVVPYPVTIDGPAHPTAAQYRVEKMKFAKVKDPETGKRVDDRSVLHYNSHITLRDIPLRAYDYIVNGKPALAWVVERQCVKTDKASGIVNDANDWAIETMNDPSYPLKLFQRVITVSLETLDIIDSLPPLDILDR